jgi:invasion protein IalB
LLFACCLATVSALAQTESQEPAATTEPKVTTTNYRDWALSCRENPETGVDDCSMFQRLVIQETNQIALNFALGFLPNAQQQRVPVAVLTFPLGIYLPGGAEMQIDSAEPIRLQIERCFRRGCQSGFAIDDALLAQLKAGSKATVKILQSREEEIDLTISLSGFSAAFAALQESAN